MAELRYLTGYPPPLIEQVAALRDQGRLGDWLQQRYPDGAHDIQSDRALYDYVTELKAQHLRKAEPLSRVVQKLLAKYPDERYQSSYGLLEDLEQCARDWAHRRHIDPFELGRHDTPERFCIAQKLYGREAEAAAMLEAFERAAAGRAELLLVSGASGIGTTAIQLARAFGAKALATAGSDEKCAACVALGADHAINYKTHDFAAEAMRLTHGKGVDVVLDMVAGDYVAREVDCLAEDGRLVIIALQGGTKANFDAGKVLRRRLHITGSTLRPRSVSFKAAIARDLREQVWPLLASGRIKPVIHATFEASSDNGAANAHRLMETNQHIGKIVLTWSK